jgi:hypothetical protein
MSNVLYSPLGSDFEHGRNFYHGDVGFGQVTLQTPEWNTSRDIGIVKVELLDREDAPVVQPYGEHMMPLHAFRDPSFIISAVHRTLRGLG